MSMDPNTIAALLKLVIDARRARDARVLQQAVDDIAVAVADLDRRMMEQDLNDVRAGFHHLDSASKATRDGVIEAELNHARGYFGRLANRSEPLGSLTTAQGRAMGELGNYYYFAARQEPEQALLAAFRCSEQFPVLGLQVFPPELFERDVRPALTRLAERGRELAAEHARQAVAHGQHVRARRRQLAWRAPAAAGYVALGVAGVHPSLIVGGVIRAKDVLAGAGPTQPAPDNAPLAAHAAQVDEVLASVASDARRRRMELEQALAGQRLPA
jgi:hypothetical protein